jgi:hypothetical protein
MRSVHRIAAAAFVWLASCSFGPGQAAAASCDSLAGMKVGDARNVSTTLIQPGSEFKLCWEALVQSCCSLRDGGKRKRDRTPPCQSVARRWVALKHASRRFAMACGPP